MRDRKMQDWKMEDRKYGVENAGLENVGPVSLREKSKKLLCIVVWAIILSYAAVVFNVLLTSAKMHSSHMDSAKNIEHVSQEHSQNHVYWRAAQGTPISHLCNRICA